MRGGRAAEVVALLVLGFGVWLGFASAGLPDVIHNSAHLATVSADRAMPDLRVISANPHSVGTATHDSLRDYLADRLRVLGCVDVTVQAATGFNTLEGPIAASVSNIVARLPGHSDGPAIVLTAHYDAVPGSHGTGDDGAGVAAILETLRALQDAPPLQHDIIILLTDGEEAGLLGAEAFVNQSPLAHRAGVVLNFEGRGNAGPVYMFQTSPGNARLIAALDASVPSARTNSLTGEVYRHLPSDTDLSIWLHSALPIGALNFADVDGYDHYHTPTDDIASFDPRVLQQMAEYAYGMTRQLDAFDLASVRTGDAIYFDAPLLGVMHYPAEWALPLALGIALFTIGLLVFLRSRFTALGIARSTTLMLLSLALPAGVVFGGWRLASALHPDYLEILQRDPYNSTWYFVAAIGITIAIVVEIQRRFGAACTAIEMVAPALVTWTLLGVVAAIKLPGASYIIAIPTIFLIVGTICWIVENESGQLNRAMIALTAVPALVLWSPLLRALEISLTAQMLGFCALLAGLLLAAMVVPIILTGSLRPWIAGAAALAGVVAIIGAEMNSGFDASHKRPDSLFYLQDTDTHEAWWASFDRGVDPWTSLALGSAPSRRTFDAYRLTPSGGGLLATVAAPIDSAPSPVHLLQSDGVDSGRRVHLHIDRTGSGESLSLVIEGGVVTAMTLNDRPLESRSTDKYSPQYHMGDDGTVLRYFGVPATGVDIWLTVQATGHALLRVTSAVEGLPLLNGKPLPPRGDSMMSKPFIPTDVTMISRTITI